MNDTDPASGSGAVVRAVDLFCGAGGLSWGLVEALREVAVKADEPTGELLADAIDLVGVNHWDRAIETHRRNHPWARHFHDDVQNVNPREVFDEPDPQVTILSGGIECTHWSKARGGKPVDEQKRMPAFDFLTWVQKLRPANVLVENVREFQQWGPVEDGTPTRNGEVFETWIDALHDLGYNVDWQVLNAADYGDATSRERLFILARREHRPEFPDPTHSPDGSGDTEPWRTAADVVDWSDPGESIWTRSRPLVNNTMQRIAEGIRRHGAAGLEPFADAVGELGKDDVKAMQERVVPARFAPLAARVLDEPFLAAPAGGTPALASPHLTKYYGTATAKPVDEPIGTITAGGQKYALCTPYLLGQHSNSVARAIDQRPVPTVTTGGKVQLVHADPFVLGQHGGAVARGIDRPLPTIATDGYVRLFDAAPFVLPRNGYHRGLHSNPAYDPASQPLHTVTAKNHDGWIVRPYLVQYNGQSGAKPIERPTPTLTARDSLALCVPECYPWGLDVRFRMLQPRELAAAQGFPPEYEFAGTKTETVEQIGNAVPVTLAGKLVESLLESSAPALTDYFESGERAEQGTSVAADGGVPDDE